MGIRNRFEQKVYNKFSKIFKIPIDAYTTATDLKKALNQIIYTNFDQGLHDGQGLLENMIEKYFNISHRSLTRRRFTALIKECDIKRQGYSELEKARIMKKEVKL